MAQNDSASGRTKYLYCRRCGRRTLHRSNFFAAGLVLTIVTLGLFIPVWLLVHYFCPHWVCDICGTTRWGIRTRANPF